MGSSNGALDGVLPPNLEVQNHRGAEGDHSGGILAVMADGHVIWVSNSVDTRAYYAAFSRAGGEVEQLEF
jgi:hypothetical protein